MSTHADHKFSITVHTDDIAVLYCLRALADYSQTTETPALLGAEPQKKNGSAVAEWSPSGFQTHRIGSILLRKLLAFCSVGHGAK